MTAISCQDETRAAARAAAREEIIAELQEIEALGPLLDPQDFAAVKFAQECKMLRLLCELLQILYTLYREAEKTF